MASSSRSRSRLTQGEQEQLIANFLDQVQTDDGSVNGIFEGDDDDEDDVPLADFRVEEAEEEEEEEDENRDVEAETDDEEDDVVPRKQRFKYQSDVTNLNNYDSIPEQESKTFVWSIKSSNLQYTWNTKKPESEANPKGAGRKPIRDKPTRGGPTRHARNHASSESEIWSQMITDGMLNKVVNFTNQKITIFRETFAEYLAKSDKKTQYKLTSLAELKAVIGIMYLRAALHLNGKSVDTVFYHETSNDIFPATMSRQRFTFLCHIMQFDDMDTRQERWKTDKFAAFREFFEAANELFVRLRTPGTHMAIDETLFPYRGRIGFKQYNPKKPAKYGILFRSGCDSTVQYTYFSLPYAGKPQVLGSPYYITGTDNYTKYLVENIIKTGGTACMKGRNISLDRYFTSMTIAEWCLEKDITITGTMRRDRQGIPTEMKKETGRVPKSTIWAYHNNKMLLSYADKKKKGTKIVLFLTTMHDTVLVSHDERVKPAPIVYYDHMKGGVDIVDLLSCMNSTRFKTPRWTMNALAFLLDTVRTNARTLYNEINNTKLSNFQFTWNLGKQLVMPFIQMRSQTSGLSASLQQKITKILGVPTPPAQGGPRRFSEVQSDEDRQEYVTRNTKTQGVCVSCRSSIHGGGYSANKSSVNNKLKKKCLRCTQFVCSKEEHGAIVCTHCLPKIKVANVRFADCDAE